MRKLLFISTILMVSFFTMGGALPLSPDTGNDSKEGVKVLYFHFTRRCATCKAVENVSRNYIETIFGDKVEFASYNLDNKETNEQASLYKVSGQSLIVVKGDVRKDITAPAFMNALNKPQKLEELLCETINPLIAID